MPATKKAKKTKKKSKPVTRTLAKTDEDIFVGDYLDESKKSDKKKITRDKRGRPTVMTKQVLAKIKHAIRMGSTEEEACSFAEIDPSTLWRYKQKNKYFAMQIKEWQNYLVLSARQNIFDSIDECKNMTDSWAYLRAKRKEEFAEQKNLNVRTGTLTIEELEEAARDGVHADESMAA